MTPEEMKSLQPGDIVTGGMGQAYIVTENHGDRATAVRTIDLTNPDEWYLARRAGDYTPPAEDYQAALTWQVSAISKMLARRMQSLAVATPVTIEGLKIVCDEALVVFSVLACHGVGVGGAVEKLRGLLVGFALSDTERRLADEPDQALPELVTLAESGKAGAAAGAAAKKEKLVFPVEKNGWPI